MSPRSQEPSLMGRTYWRAENFNIDPEPLLVSLLKYRQKKNRKMVPKAEANLVSSISVDGKQRLILDLDCPFSIGMSGNEECLYLTVPGKSMDRLRSLWYRYYGELSSYRRASRSPETFILGLPLPEGQWRAIPSSSSGHVHLYIDIPLTNGQWRRLMYALYKANAIELGFLVWSLRRGGNFVRLPGVVKTDDPLENTKPTHGWLFKLRDRE